MIRYPARERAKRGQRGVVAIQVGVFLVVLLSVAALTIDVARWVIVRNELQNAADSAALAGARQLTGSLVGTADSTIWATASANATNSANSYAGQNYANGASIATPQTVLAGYWDVNAANQGTSLPSSLPTTIGSPTDKPAVMVTVNLNPTSGAGMPTLLGRMLGVSSMHASATAVAIISAPGTAAPGSLFPMTLSKCFYSNSAFWNNGKPVTTAEFSIGNGAANVPGCTSPNGQWTTFNLNTSPTTGPCAGQSANSVPATQCLIQNGNGTAMTVGQNTYIQPGVKSAIYDNNNFPATPPMLVTVPVVADNAINTAGSTPILGFAAFQIDYVVGANGKSLPSCTGKCTLPVNCVGGSGGECIIGHLVSGIAGSTSAGGLTTNYFGAVTPPTLANLPSSEWY